jgi:PD-(D/E)XK nuclease superfamily
VNREVPIEIRYKDMTFDEAFRADIVVDEKVIGAKVSGASKRSAQKASSKLFAVNGLQTQFLTELRRSTDETTHHTRGEWAEG